MTEAVLVGAGQTVISLVTVGPETVWVVVCVTVGPGMTVVTTSPSSVTVRVIGGRTVVMTSVMVDASWVTVFVTVLVSSLVVVRVLTVVNVATVVAVVTIVSVE
jgi:hypothetical protein